MTEPKDRIEVQYLGLSEIAQQFDRESQLNQALLSQTREKMDMLLQSGWKGTAADAFMNEMQGSVLPGYERMVKALDETVHTTQMIIQTFQQGEAEAAGAFKVSPGYSGGGGGGGGGSSWGGSSGGGGGGGGGGSWGGAGGSGIPTIDQAIDQFRGQKDIIDAFSASIKPFLKEGSSALKELGTVGDVLKVVNWTTIAGQDFANPAYITENQKLGAAVVDIAFDAGKGALTDALVVATAGAIVGVVFAGAAVSVPVVLGTAAIYFVTAWTIGQAVDIDGDFLFNQTGLHAKVVDGASNIIGEVEAGAQNVWNGLQQGATQLMNLSNPQPVFQA